MKKREIRTSPATPPAHLLSRLYTEGQSNNILAFHVQMEQLQLRLRHVLRNQIARNGNKDEGKRLRNIQGEVKEHQGIAFEGYFPSKKDLEKLASQAQSDTEADRLIQMYVGNMQGHIQREQERWGNTQFVGKDLSNLQDTHVAQHLLPSTLGGAVTTFGSARQNPGSPNYEAVRWLNRTIVSGLLQPDGRTERVHSGAGPGIMEAANKGAMEGRIALMNRLENQLLDCPDDPVILRNMDTIRGDVQSMGIRIDLSFEQSFNKFLQFNLTMKNFGARKTALVSATLGRSVNDNGDDAHMERHGRHPAFFVTKPGFGTMDELLEVVTLVQCSKMKPVPIIAIGKETNRIIRNLIDELAAEGTIHPSDRDLITMTDSGNEVDALLAYLEHYNLPETDQIKASISGHKPHIL